MDDYPPPEWESMPFGSERDAAMEAADRRFQQRTALIQHGEPFPVDFDHASPVGRASVVRAIRLHHSFAMSDAVKDLCARHAVFARARNARLIMSNIIPSREDMSDSSSGVCNVEEQTRPYCIWFPDFATEDTYRRLAAQFPWMRYQVGRACAAAGYHELYAELDLVPDVCIAEEARESGTAGGRIIYDIIMSAPARYRVMDDCTLSIDMERPVTPAFLNGDTQVRWKLKNRRGMPDDDYFRQPSGNPCIEEDARLGCNEQDFAYELNLTYNEAQLLFRPLPPDLPTVQKDVLIHMAARQGNIDRYVRLARPLPMSEEELFCVLHGIYIDTLFARFWRAEIDDNTPRVQRLGRDQLDSIKQAISARRIMIGDDAEFDNGWKDDEPLPFMIWWPLEPDENLLHYLASIEPRMHEAICVTCIIYDFQGLYSTIKHPPTYYMWRAAQRTTNPFYKQQMEAIAAEQGDDRFMEDPELWGDNDFKGFLLDMGCLDGDRATDQGIWDGLLPDLERFTIDAPFDSIIKDGYVVEKRVWNPRDIIDKFASRH